MEYKDPHQKFTVVVVKNLLGLKIMITFHDEDIPSSYELVESIKLILDTPWWVR